MISKTDNIDNFVQNLEKLSSTADWLQKMRKDGLERFYELGIPTTKNEEWKYLNLESVKTKKFHLAHEESHFLNKEELAPYMDSRETNLVLINGVFNAELSNFADLPKGIEILPLAEAITSRKDQIQRAFEKYNPEAEDAFISLNKALTTCGAYVHVNQSVHFDKLIHIIHVINGSQENTVIAPRTIINLEASSEITILETHLGLNHADSYLSIPVTDVSLAENATLHYCKSQAEGSKAYHIGNTRVWQEKNSNFDGFSLMTGASITRNDLNIIVNGEGSNSNLNGLYCVADTQVVDNHSTVDHKTPNCTSNQLYKGLLTDSSRAIFNGKIFVRPIAQQTNSYQLNKNLLLGTDCRVDTKPQLEIFADDVKCTHGATIGQLNEDELFYLQARGIPKKKAILMLSHGFVDEIFEHIPNKSICEKLNRLIEPIFQHI